MKEDRLDVNARMMGWGHCGQLYLLEVEFWGTVIVGEHGYRASRQRVLSCRPYGAPFQETSGFVPGSLLHDEQGMFLPYRQDFKVNRVHRVSLADATASLGTEVIYDESVLAVGWQRRVDQKIQAEKLARHLETLQRAKEDFTKFTKPRNPAEGQGRFYSQDWTGRLDD